MKNTPAMVLLCLPAVLAATQAWSQNPPQVLAFQGFETNSRATLLEESGAAGPGLLTEGQQELELFDSGEVFENGNPIREFRQPSQTFNVLDPNSPLPERPTGRVYDATDGSQPWRLRWVNTRVTDAEIQALVEAQETADELAIFLASGGTFFPELNYIQNPSINASLVTGPVVPEAFDLSVAILDVSNSNTLGIGDVNGVGGDTNDATGVSGGTLFTEFDGNAPATPPEGNQAFFAVDADGLLELQLDPIDATGFGDLELSFQLAAGGNSNTSYVTGDAFFVEVNGEEVFALRGSQFGESPDPETGQVDELDIFADGGFSTIELDLSQFNDQQSVQVSFFFNNNNDGGNNYDAFSLDDVQVTGVEGALGPDGDFNGDGFVDSADFTVWRDSLEQTVLPGTGADANGDSFVDIADYAIWKQNFGQGSPPAAGLSAAPEPNSVWCVFSTGLLVLNGRRSRLC